MLEQRARRGLGHGRPSLERGINWDPQGDKQLVQGPLKAGPGSTPLESSPVLIPAAISLPAPH